MHQKQNTILGISPGTRSTGYAIISDGELVDWGEKVTKGKWSKQQEAKIIEFVMRIIKDYSVTRLAIKRTDPSRSSKNLENIYSLLESQKLRSFVTIRSFSIEDIKSQFSQMQNKLDLIDEVIKQFPELGCDRFMRRMEHIRVFEAVAVSNIF